MDRAALTSLLDEVRTGALPPDEAARRLAGVLPGTGGSEAPGAPGEGPLAWRIDHHRALRCGAPEVVLGSGKTPAALVEIAREVLARSERLLVTRVDAERAARLCAAFPAAVHHEAARAVTVH